MSAPLSARLRDAIRRDGPMRFDRFQAAALYDPEHGYYERTGRVGKEGDFVTGASWHPAFARAVARIARRVAEEAGTLRVVDVGAGEGELLHGLREALGAAAELVGVEPSAVRRGRGRERVPDATWLADAAELPAGGAGLVLGYELVDALPVRSLRVGRIGAIFERLVGLDTQSRFAWTEAPAEDAGEIRARLERRGALLEEGLLFEVRPGAPDLARSLARAIGRGLLLLFDYGARTRALYSMSRPHGTLEAFLGHRVSRDVLSDPGSRDITAWVDFGELEEVLAHEGLVVRGLASQTRVLVAGGIAEELALADPETPLSPAQLAERNAIAKLFVPGGMGDSLRVLVGERETTAGVQLT